MGDRLGTSGAPGIGSDINAALRLIDYVRYDQCLGVKKVLMSRSSDSVTLPTKQFQTNGIVLDHMSEFMRDLRKETNIKLDIEDCFGKLQATHLS